MKAKCVCKKKFEPEIKRKMKDKKIQDIYFECPGCGKYYHIAYTDEVIRELNIEMQNVKVELLKDKNNSELLEKMQGLMKKHKKLMDKLNKK